MQPESTHAAAFRWNAPLVALTISVAAGVWAGVISRPLAPDKSAGAAVSTGLAARSGNASGSLFLHRLDSLDKNSFAAELEDHTGPGPLSALEEHLILTKWAATDPAACVAWMNAHGRTAALESVLRIWGSHDPAGAWKAMASVPLKGWVWNSCFHHLCDAIIAVDPDVFLTLPAFNTPPDDNYSQARTRALRKLAATNPELAMQRISESNSFDFFSVRAVAEVWVKAQPEAALAWSLTSGWEPENLEDFQRAAVTTWAEKDPQAAADFLVSQPALLHSKSIDPPDPRAEVMARLAAVDMKTAMDWLSRNFSAADRIPFVKNLRGVLPHDMTAWLPEFLASVPEPDLRAALLKEVLAGRPGYPQHPPEVILTKLNDVPATPEWLTVIRAVTPDSLSGAWQLTDERILDQLHGPVRAAAALELLKRPQSGEPSAKLLEALARDPTILTREDIGGLFRTSPSTGSAALEKLGYPDQMVAQGIESWAGKDPPAAAAWVSAIPDDHARQTAAGALITAWCRTDEYSASEWITALPPGPARDEAAVSLATQLAGPSPADAWTWMMSVSEAAERPETLRQIAASWLKSDAAAASTSIRSAPLPAALREELLSGKSAP